MILGRIADTARDGALLPAAILRALEALQKVDLLNAAPGRYEIDGDRLFYLLQDVELRALADSQAEAHRSYADIQMPLSAAERYGFALPQETLAPCDDQIEARDLAFYPDPAGEFFFDLTPGSFAVFLPGEFHRPALAIEGPRILRKVVVKVHGSLLGR